MKSNPLARPSVSVSSTGLAVDINPTDLKTNLEQKGFRVRFALQKLPSDRPLKDISNNLHVKSAHLKPNDNGPKVSSRGQENWNADGLEMDASGQARSTEPEYHCSYPAHQNGPVRFGSTFPTGRPPDPYSSKAPAEALGSTTSISFPSISGRRQQRGVL